MSSNLFNKPLVLITKASLQLALLIIIPHLLIIAMALFMPHFTLLLRLIIILIVLLSLVYFISLHLLKILDKSIHSIKQDSASNWSILLADSNKQDYKAVTLQTSSFYSELLIIINFSEVSDSFLRTRKYLAIFTPDSLSSDEFRRLRVRLKIEKSVYK